MEIVKKFTSKRTLITLSLIIGAVIVYPNLMKLWSHHTRYIENIGFFVFRYFFFCSLIWFLLTLNIKKQGATLGFRLLGSFLVSAAAYVLYLLVSFASEKYLDKFSGILLFQFVVICVICSLIGHIFALYSEQAKKEHEIEQLKIENLQSRCDALTNQINPHFFFNSLNGLTALVRGDNRERTLEYINKLSGVFRYILQSEKRGLVPLKEELDFLESFRFLQEVRYEDKLLFNINIDQDKQEQLLLPVLSLLPLAENVVKHNVVDSENPMIVTVELNSNDELVFTNPICEKIDPPSVNGIGLPNLKNRFALLMNSTTRVENNGKIFVVYLPLKRYEGTDSRR